MTDDIRSLKRYQFASDTNILSTLSKLNIDHLDVTDKRAFVIYTRAILNIDVIDGRLNDARIVDVEVFDLPPGADNLDPGVLTDKFIKRIGTVIESDWYELDKG